MKTDLAKVENRELWLRHPVLGDPSFDTFERVGAPVHISEPPYEWAVNGSLYRDFDGTWYCYCGLYLRGYACSKDDYPSRFVIYRSENRGADWEYLGFGFEKGFRFPGWKVDWDSCPDVVLTYDERSGKYLLAYDTSCNTLNWETAHNVDKYDVDSGGALAWADTPAGPFRRMDSLVFSNKKVIGTMGRWRRLYAMSVYPRKNDYIAFALNDSSVHYAWGLSVMTAPSPEGPWSEPKQILCCDRPDFYPCPCEFHPVQLINGTCIANATSVALNRDYQFIFTAPLERAHDSGAWRMEADGSVWHSRPLPEEYAGIWGQTYNGFVEPDTGRYVVMFPSKTKDDLGTINIAARPWDQPNSDGFTMASHEGPSVTRTRAFCGDFTLELDLTAGGQTDIAFDCRGVLGPNDNTALSVPCESALRSYSAVRVTQSGCLLLTVLPDGIETVFAESSIPAKTVRIERRGAKVTAFCNGVLLGSADLSESVPAALGFVLAPYSYVSCTRYELEADLDRFTQEWNVLEGMLGAGQRNPEKTVVEPDAPLERDCWHRTADGVVGEGRVALKWNVVCDGFTVRAPRAKYLGEMGVWVDGCFVGGLPLSSDRADYSVSGLAYGRHAVRVEPLSGRIAVNGITVTGMPE